MKVDIYYFAKLREERGLSQETIQSSSTSLISLYSMLRQKHGLTLNQDVLRVAVNDEFCSWDQKLQEGDSITFVPPVSGG